MKDKMYLLFAQITYPLLHKSLKALKILRSKSSYAVEGEIKAYGSCKEGEVQTPNSLEGVLDGRTLEDQGQLTERIADGCARLQAFGGDAVEQRGSSATVLKRDSSRAARKAWTKRSCGDRGVEREWNENGAARREKRVVETEERKINFGFLISN
jgi:hypothetical protein